MVHFLRGSRAVLLIAAMVLGLPLAASSALGMKFQLVPLNSGKCRQHCPVVMVATGEMTSGTADAFFDFVQSAVRQGARNVLVIDSPGGRVVEGVNFGLILRQLQTNVFVGRVLQKDGLGIAVNGSCLSACVYTLMGGSKRFVSADSRIAVHREYLPGSFGKDPLSALRGSRRFPEVTAMLKAYTSKMGVDPALIDLAERYGGGSIRFLTPGEITRFRLAKISK